ncbi:hypothetical protein BDB01DRAFT_727106, partial [Pilobolus umbonatus]
MGPGLWRANPAFCADKKFCQILDTKLSSLMDREYDDLSDIQMWEKIKEETHTIVNNYGSTYVPWRKKTLHSLQRKRNRILRTKPSPALRQLILPKIDKMIHKLQQEIVDIASIKAGVRWREQGETSPGYLKRMHTTRTLQQYMPSLTVDQGAPPSDTSRYNRDTPSLTSNLQEMQDITRDYYRNLYQQDPVAKEHIDHYL